MSTQKIGRYEIVRELGRGGMAVVYLGYDPSVKRQVAIKLLPRQFTFDPQFRARFQREAEVIGALEHPFIVPVHDFGGLDDQPFIVMRFMPGGSLLDRLRSGPLNLPDTARIINRLGEALDLAHSQGIVHRDLKPGNILFDGRGEAYLSDFGIAKISESSQALTGTGMIGTPEYMSPDQARGLKELDGRSDVYSLGVVVFQTLTGSLPYRADTPMSMAVAHITQPVPSIRAVKPDLPMPVESVIARAMAKDPKSRYATAGELARDLNRTAQQTEPRLQMPSGQATVFEPYSTPPAQTTAPPMQTTAPPRVGPTMPPPMQTPAPQFPVTAPAPPQPRGGGGRMLAVAGGAGVLAVLAIGCCGLLYAMGMIPGFATPEPPTPTFAFVPTDTFAPPVTDAPPPTVPPASVVPDTPVPNVSGGTSVADAWPAVLVDDFSSDKNIWPVGNDTDTYAVIDRAISGGLYSWDISANQDVVSHVRPEMDNIGDFYVSVEARQASGVQGGEYGLILRHDGANYYLFLVSENQKYSFYMWNNNSWTTLIEWTDTKAVQPGAFNLIAVTAEGSTFIFYINGIEVGRATDGTLASGEVGIATELYNAGDVAVFEFDNFQVRQAWPLVIADAFDANTHDWNVGAFDDPRVQADRSIGGTYLWNATALDGFVWRTSPTVDNLTDVFVAVDARRVSGPEDAPYGIVFRDDGDNYYYFKISDDGYFKVDLLLNSEWQDIIDWTSSDAVRHGEYNRLTAIAQGAHMTFFINGQQVGEADDDRVPSGIPGVVIELFDAGDQSTIEFDNFEVRAP